MEKGINFKISEFKNELSNCINYAGLPPGIIQPIMELALAQIINQNAHAIMSEKEIYEKAGDPQNG